MKGNARKVRRIGKGDEVIAGFAGATADAFTCSTVSTRSWSNIRPADAGCSGAAKDWRTDKYLRNLEAMMLVADKSITLAITGNGDVLEPDMARSPSAPAAITPLPLPAPDGYGQVSEEVARKALDIAADICVYTNHNLVVETLDAE